MTTPPVKHSRVCASERAVAAALRAMISVALPVHKLCVVGAHVEIHCRGGQPEVEPEEHDGLEKL